MRFFSHCCHQMPARSFFFGGYQLPLCARCCGLLLGQAIGLLSAFLLEIPMPLCGLLTLPLIVDGTVQLLTAYRSTNPRRFLTGILCGCGFAHAVVRTALLWFHH